jgi:hypothetical protein
MVKYLPTNPSAAPIHVIVQDALRAAVHAPSEREGFDLLADALSRVAQVARGEGAEGNQPNGGVLK